MNGNSALLIMAINRLPGHSGWHKKQVLDSCRDEKDLPAAIAEYGRLRSRRSRTPLPQAPRLMKEAEGDLKRMRFYKIGYRLLGEALYPASLALIEDPPFILFHRGAFLDAEKPSIAIVGTRRPSSPAQRQAFKLGLEFSYAGYPVVSGLAFGIDRAAHEGALSGGGTTWAVLAGGLDRPSPMAHRRLAVQILDGGGCLLGEMPPGYYPAKYAFPRRNRILSGLCRGCIIVQAPEKSGALITADFALDQNRDVYVASVGTSGRASAGTMKLEQQGAQVISGAEDVLGDWGRFLDIRRVCSVSGPETQGDVARLMKQELNGRIHRYMGGWFEYRGA